MLAMFLMCTVQHGSHQQHLAMDSKNVASATEELNFSFNSYLNSSMWLVATTLEHAGLVNIETFLKNILP